MIKKRLIATVVVKDDLAVQSFAFNNYLPLGDPLIIVENLDRWCVDEIIILDIGRSKKGLGPNFKLIERMQDFGVSTPITYGGGIRGKEDAIKLVKLGIERIVVDNLLLNKINEVKTIAMCLGAQAVIGCIPVMIKNNFLIWFNYLTKENRQLNQELVKIFNSDFLSELLIIDYQNEGSEGKFNIKILETIEKLTDIPILAFGGINKKKIVENVLNFKNINGVAIGNALNYKEHNYQTMKSYLKSSLLRPHYYNSKNQNVDFS